MPQFPVTVVGNLTKDPQFKVINGETYVARIRIAASRSVRDEQTASGWRDIDHLYINAEMWGQIALNAAASLRKGMAVVATGRLVTNEWIKTDDNGQESKRSAIQMKVERLGIDLQHHVASTIRTGSQVHEIDGVPRPELPSPEVLAAESAARDEEERRRQAIVTATASLAEPMQASGDEEEEEVVVAVA